MPVGRRLDQPTDARQRGKGDEIEAAIVVRTKRLAVVVGDLILWRARNLDLIVKLGGQLDPEKQIRSRSDVNPSRSHAGRLWYEYASRPVGGPFGPSEEGGDDQGYDISQLSDGHSVPIQQGSTLSRISVCLL
ncbi:hypothetical protein SAMN05444166_3936 [Singulisphaera sp. GP187]|nr:hypothetical protein SAMN05444166_3936 [Singulisphaera sp. GP187]